VFGSIPEEGADSPVEDCALRKDLDFLRQSFVLTRFLIAKHGSENGQMLVLNLSAPCEYSYCGDFVSTAIELWHILKSLQAQLRFSQFSFTSQLFTRVVIFKIAGPSVRDFTLPILKRIARVPSPIWCRHPMQERNIV
jgi:hypothetical protein